MAITKVIRPFFMHRLHRPTLVDYNLESTQRSVLSSLIASARNTMWGHEHGYAGIDCYEHYVERVDITPYDTLRPIVMRMIAGEKDLLWPGRTLRFAQSSGTSDGKSKYIPVTDDSLRLNHFSGSADVVARYLDLYPDSRILDGRSFILGGSFANELHLPTHTHTRVGDLSANLIDSMNPIANLVRIPSKKIALEADWNRKLPALIDAASKADVTNISGVPSWFLTVLQGILQATGATRIHDVWPNLEVFFHGGISFVPYREQYNAIIDPSRMRYLETYNASEGFFAMQDTRESHAMALLIDSGVFYEFIPTDSPDATPLPAWKVEEGKVYAMIISSANGLWRYPLGDTVKIESVAPLRITIAGRTKSYINAFGEEVMVHNTDAALAKACAEHHCHVANYTAAPVYADGGHRGHHQWLIEFSTPPADMNAFGATLDHLLTLENSDYQAKRQGNIFLDPLSITIASTGLFDRWLASTGKLGGQRKIPRLSNDRRLIESMLAFNNL